MFETVPGNEEVKSFLRTAVKKGAVGQSLLFTGSDIEHMGKVALELASSTLSHSGAHHPDLHVYHPEGKLGMHTIESMRRMSEEVYLSPFEGHRKVFVVFQAERMLPTSSNALLKTFEEPAEDALIILISAQPEQILPTIKSRCRIVRFAGETAHAPITEIPGLSDELYEILKASRFGTYKGLTAHTDKIGSLFDAYKKERAKMLRDQMLSEFAAKATMVQTEAIDKESEGLVAMECASIVTKMFEAVVYWYRDIELLQFPEFEKQIHHTHYIKELKVQRFIRLDEVTEFLKNAQLAYQRSTSLSLCLENLFLKLGKV